MLLEYSRTSLTVLQVACSRDEVVFRLFLYLLHERLYLCDSLCTTVPDYLIVYLSMDIGHRFARRCSLPFPDIVSPALADRGPLLVIYLLLFLLVHEFELTVQQVLSTTLPVSLFAACALTFVTIDRITVLATEPTMSTFSQCLLIL